MAVIIPGKIYQAQEDFGSVETTLVSAESGFRNAASVFVIIGWWRFELCSYYTILWPLVDLLLNIRSNKLMHFFHRMLFDMVSMEALHCQWKQKATHWNA